MNYTISFGNTFATINSIGAELTSFKHNETEYIWQRDNGLWLASSPVLFPTIGGLKNDSAIFEGESYKMAKHGFARNLPFAVHMQSESSITFSLTNCEQTASAYPYEFRLLVGFSIVSGKLVNSFKVENLSQKEMPFALGAHPGIKTNIADGVFDDCYIEFDEQEKFNALRCGELGLINIDKTENIGDSGKILPLKYSLFDADAVILRNISSRNISLKNSKQGKILDFSFSGFNTLGLWSFPKKNAPYVCLEAWQGLPDCLDEGGEFKNKRDVITLPPQGTYEAWISLTIR